MEKNGLKIETKVSAFTVVKGYGYSDVDSVSAFDNALVNAGIGNYNLVPVSSIIPGKAIRLTQLPSITPGAIIHCVLAKSHLTANETGVVCLGYSLSAEYGIVAEAIGIEVNETKNRCSHMLKEMASNRSEMFHDPIIEIQEIKCGNHLYACGVVVLLLI